MFLFFSMIKQSIAFIICTFFLIQVYAQEGTVRGFVYDKQNGEPVLFCNIQIKNTKIGTTTDINGMYTLPKVKPGNYTLIVSYLGYNTLEESITLKPNEIITKNFEISQSSLKLDEVVVSAERKAMKTEVKAAVIKVTKKDLEIIPTIGGEPDLAQYMQIIPGVVFTGDQGGQLYIRGGSPIQNKVLLDGMTIYSPFHSIGLFSVFDSDIIKNTDVYTGGFGAQYGGRISSIMDIKTIDGNKKQLGGKFSANTFGAKLFLEGPLNKKENSSFIFSGKTSYLDKTSEYLYKDPILFFDEKGLPYSYTDLYGKISLTGKGGSKLNIFGFNFTDQVNYENVSKLNWNSNGIGSEFILIPANSPILVEGNFAYSDYAISLDESGSKLRTSNISGYNMGLDFTYFQTNSKLKYGFDIHGFETNFTTYNALNFRVEQLGWTSEFSGYINYQYSGNRLVIEPGFRVQSYAGVGVSPEPRIGLKYLATDALRIKFAAGLYSQNILSTVSDRDIVNLFTGIISSPEELPLQENGVPYATKFQKSRHLISGFEYDVSKNIDFQVEGYIKDFTQLTNINRNNISNDVGDQFIVETGIAKGIDMVIKYTTRKLYLWTVYSLGFVKRDDGVNQYIPHFDRRHNVNFVASYKWGKDNSWKSDFRWNLGSGFPFTQTQGFFESLTFSDGLSTDYTVSNGDLGISYAELNNGRLPYYHRLDISVSKRFKLNNRIAINITSSVTNTYNRENIFYFNRVKYERINQLPLMPSFGINCIF